MQKRSITATPSQIIVEQLAAFERLHAGNITAINATVATVDAVREMNPLGYLAQQVLKELKRMS